MLVCSKVLLMVGSVCAMLSRSQWACKGSPSLCLHSEVLSEVYPLLVLLGTAFLLMLASKLGLRVCALPSFLKQRLALPLQRSCVLECALHFLLNSILG